MSRRGAGGAQGQGVQVLDAGVGVRDGGFQVLDLQAVLPHLRLFREEVAAPVFPVVIQVHRAAVGAFRHPHGQGQVVGDAVVEQGVVAVIGQKHPSAGGFVAAHQVRVLLQLDLVGLFGIGPGGVPPAFDLLQAAVVEDGTVGVQEEGGAFGLVALLGLHKGPVLLGVRAAKIEGGEVFRAHEAHGAGVVPLGEGQGIHAVGRGLGKESGEVEGLPAGQDGFPIGSGAAGRFPGKFQNQFLQVCPGGEEEPGLVLDALGADGDIGCLGGRAGDGVQCGRAGSGGQEA